MTKKTLATAWLDGCSGCHMSILDMDERIIAVAEKADIVYGPLVDLKEFPEMVDIAVVEGAVSSEDDLAKIKKIRKHCRLLVSLGDCAVNSNVPSMRNTFAVSDILERAYRENKNEGDKLPAGPIPALLKQACPLHEYVEVDVYVPGCPPSADAIFFVLSELLEDRIPNVSELTRFGA